MKYVALLLIPLVLTACGASPEEVARQKNFMQSQLPEGCEFIDLGQYLDIDRVVAVVCEGKSTTSISAENVTGSGKNTNTERFVAFSIK